MKKIITTTKQFNDFKKEAAYWLDYFGLKQWEMTFKHKELESVASCAWDIEAKQCTITLSKEWGTQEATKREVSLSAFHEVCELMLAPLADSLYETNSVAFVASRSHDIINRLQNTIFTEHRGE